MVEFRLLGPLEFRVDRATVPLGGPRQRAVLAVLLLNANRFVPADRVVRLVWDDVPDSAGSNLRTYASRLRRLLHLPGEAESRLESHDGGYLLRVEPGELDLEAFEDLVQAAGQAEGAAAVDLLGSALARWRGRPLTGLSGSDGLDAEVARLTDRHDEVRERHLRARMDAGEPAEVVADVRTMLAVDPLRESLTDLLMRALHRSGRQAEALRVFRDTRDRLVAELGVEPGAALQRLHQQILTADPGLDQVDPAELPPTALVQRGLPPDIAEFTGRDSEVKALLDLARYRPERAPVVAVVHGMAGVGKTRLAVHAAHVLAAAGHGADGQLYVDLRGFDPEQPPSDPTAVLGAFLGLLGVPATQLPAQREARAAMFRDRLARRDFLLVLDNAADEAQVRPLLPGTADCTVLVTSRRQLALDGAGALALDVFTDAEALRLLSVIVGAERITDGADDLVALCGGLPLAVALAAYRLRSRPAWRVADLVGRLRDRDRVLTELSTRDRAVAGVLALSYDALTPPQQQVFRLLGVHPGQDATADSAAQLADLDSVAAEDLLDSLLDENLLSQTTPGRYRMHDLVRAYAAGLVPAAEADAALERLVDWYVATTEAANKVLYTRLSLLPFTTSRRPAHFTETGAALAWLDTERPALVEAALRSTAHGGDWRLCVSLRTYLRWAGHHADWQATTEAFLAVSGTAEDPRVLCDAQRNLAAVRHVAGDTEASVELYTAALSGARRCGWDEGEEAVLYGLADVYQQIGRMSQAVECCHQVIAIAQAAGRQTLLLAARSDLAGCYFTLGRLRQANEAHATLLRDSRAAGMGHNDGSTLANIAHTHHRLGEYDQALRYCAEALERNSGSRRRSTLAYTHLCLAGVHRDTGDLTRALDHARTALDLSRAAAPTMHDATALAVLGSVLRCRGDAVRAAERCEQAVEVARDRGRPYALAAAWLGLAEARLDLGETAAATDLARQTHRLAAEHGYRALEGEAATFLARLDRDLALAESALAIHRECGARLPEAHTLAVLAGLVTDPHGAEEYRRAATAAYDELGTPPFLRLLDALASAPAS